MSWHACAYATMFAWNGLELTQQRVAMFLVVAQSSCIDRVIYCTLYNHHHHHHHHHIMYKEFISTP